MRQPDTNITDITVVITECYKLL